MKITVEAKIEGKKKQKKKILNRIKCTLYVCSELYVVKNCMNCIVYSEEKSSDITGVLQETH